MYTGFGENVRIVWSGSGFGCDCDEDEEVFFWDNRRVVRISWIWDTLENGVMFGRCRWASLISNIRVQKKKKKSVSFEFHSSRYDIGLIHVSLFPLCNAHVHRSCLLCSRFILEQD